MNSTFFSSQDLLFFFQKLLLIAIAVGLARMKGRNPFPWAIGAYFFNIWALLLLIFLPKGGAQENMLNKKQGMNGADISEKSIQIKEKQEEKAVLPSPVQQTDSSWTVGQIVTAEWFYVGSAKSAEGPYRIARLQELALEGVITENSWVWCELFSGWRKVGSDPLIKTAILGREIA